MTHTPSVLFLAAFVSVTLSGCILAPFARSTADFVASPFHRETMLQESMGDFHRDLAWNDRQGALSHATDEGRADVAREMGEGNAGRKIVDVKVLSIDYEDEHSAATVKSVVRFFRLPTNVVEVERKEEGWTFGRISGWQIKKFETLPTDGAVASSYGELVP